MHGDFGRTVPSIGSLLNCRADILQLDVTDVEDRWSVEEDVEGDGVSSVPSPKGIMPAGILHPVSSSSEHRAGARQQNSLLNPGASAHDEAGAKAAVAKR